MGLRANPYTHVVNESLLGTVLFFDGDCTFCTKSARLGQRLHLKCEFTPLQCVDPASIGIDPTRAQQEVPFRDGHGTILYGHEAIGAALRTGSPFWCTLGHVITLGPMNRLSAQVYRVVSRHRSQLPGDATTRKFET